MLGAFLSVSNCAIIMNTISGQRRSDQRARSLWRCVLLIPEVPPNRYSSVFHWGRSILCFRTRQTATATIIKRLLWHTKRTRYTEINGHREWREENHNNTQIHTRARIPLLTMASKWNGFLGQLIIVIRTGVIVWLIISSSKRCKLVMKSQTIIVRAVDFYQTGSKHCNRLLRGVMSR